VESRPVSAAEGDLDDLRREVAIAAIDEDAHWQSERYGVPSRFACPDCGGVLWASSATGPLTFRCEVGHAYSAGTLAEQQTEEVERAMWAALRALEDKAELAARRVVAAREREGGSEDVVRRLTVQREAAQAHAAAIRGVLRSNGRSGMSTGDSSARPDPERRAD
jgi:two-component system chemotaxis response regulator CheB